MSQIRLSGRMLVAGFLLCLQAPTLSAFGLGGSGIYCYADQVLLGWRTGIHEQIPNTSFGFRKPLALTTPEEVRLYTQSQAPEGMQIKSNITQYSCGITNIVVDDPRPGNYSFGVQLKTRSSANDQCIYSYYYPVGQYYAAVCAPPQPSLLATIILRMINSNNILPQIRCN
jgi:hypothetical protein